jgi:O-antigen/teichoic acid export membrane protein
MSDVIVPEELVARGQEVSDTLWTRIRGQLSKPFVAGVASLAGGAAIANLVAIATAPICTRIYTPRDFGIFAQFTAITGILLPAASMGFEISIPLEKDDEGAKTIGRLCLAIVAAVAILSACLFIFAPTVTPGWIDPSMVGYWWIALITVAASGYYQMATYLAIRNRAYGAIGKTTFQQAIGSAAVQVFGGLLIRGPGALLVSTAVASGLGGQQLVRACGSAGALWRDKWNWKEITSFVRKYWGIAGGSLSSNTLNAAAAQLPVLMVSAVYGLKICGLFLLAARLVSVTDRVITMSVSRTFYGEAALRFAEDPRLLRSLFVKAVLSLAIVGTAGAVAIWFLAPPLTRLVFGSAWAEAGLYARCLAPRFVGTMICSPVSDTTFILGRRMSKTALEIIRVSSTAALFWLCHATHRSPSFALLGFSTLHLSIGLAWTGMLMRWINKACDSAAASVLSPAISYSCCSERTQVLD